MLILVLRPRLVDPGLEVMAALKELVHSPRSFMEAYYYEASRDDQLLAAFAEGPLYAWREQGRLVADVGSVVAWLSQKGLDGDLPDWSDGSRIRVAQGLLAALRDFGILTGTVRKEFAHPSLSIAGFGYVAYPLPDAGASSRSRLSSPVSTLWLCDD